MYRARCLLLVILSTGGCAVQREQAYLPPPDYCTRSLAGVNCWNTPNPFGYYQREVADGPWELTPEQERNRAIYFWR